jgi:hypothetical protein
MTTFKFFGAIAIVSAMIATPALAQQAIQEPGAYAFYHPNGDLGLGASRPADAMASDMPGSMAEMRGATMSHPLPVRRHVRAY